MNQSVGWRGLVSLVTVLALLLLIQQIRKSLPPSDGTRKNPQSPVARIPDGPPVRIAPEDLTRAGRKRNDNGLEMTFCWCPPGAFHMGRVPDRLRRFRDIDIPVDVTLNQGFWMGKHEVTQAQWRSIVGTTLREQRAKDPTQPRPVGDGTMRDHVGEGPDYPIYFISHAEAENFCQKLTEAERAAGRIEPGWEYRLPTEAQWEFACRAGTTTVTAFGDGLSSTQANFDGSQPFDGAPSGPYLHETTPVGSYPPNAWGLHDMHGNVWEWCLDGYQRRPEGGADPLEKPTSSQRVMRGGCWHNPGSMCLTTSRGPGETGSRGSGLGFRVALVPTGF